MSRRITPESSPETLRQEAKDWLRRLRAGDTAARARLDAVTPSAPAVPTLRDVQHAVARELGFAGWSALKARKTTSPAPASSETIARYETMATHLLDAYRLGTPEAMEQHWADTWHRREWHVMRRYVQLDLGKRAESVEGRRATGDDAIDITIDDARWLIAREQGFEDWSALIAHATDLVFVEGKTAPRGVHLVVRSANDQGESGASTRRWDDVFDALEDDEAIGIDAHGQMTPALLERVASYEQVSVLRLHDSAALTDDALRQLARLPNLRVLDLSGCAGLTDAGFAQLAALASLEEVSLRGTQVTDAGVAALTRCDRLTRVDLSGTRTGDGALRALRGKPRLAHLDTGAFVTEAGVAQLHEFPVFKSWQGGAPTFELTSPRAGPNFLHLRGEITDACLARMVGLDGLFGLNIDDPRLPMTPAGLASLVELPRLGMLAIDAVDESMKLVAEMPALRSLTCQDTTASDDGWVALSKLATLEQIWGRRCHGLGGRGFEALAKLPALRSLSVSCLNVPDASVAALPRFPALRELMPMDIPDAGYRHIAKCEALERLTLMYCRDTTDAATEHVVRLPALTSYFASYTLITDRTPHLLATMPSLEKITLQACAGVTDAGVAALKQAPRLRELSISGMQHVTRAALAGFPSTIKIEFAL